MGKATPTMENAEQSKMDWGRQPNSQRFGDE